MDFDVLRETMFDTQLRTWSVSKEKVFDILREIKRENFVSKECKSQALFDTELPLLDTSEIMFPPKVEARLLNVLCDRPSSSSVVIGSGSGYFAALLSRISTSVYCLEIIDKLVAFSKSNCSCSGVGNVDILAGDVFSHDFSSRKFDTIVICGSVPNISDKFFSIAAPCACIVGFEGVFPAVTAVCYSRDGFDKCWNKSALFDYYVPPLVNPDLDLFEF
ncbi:protein-L-isoaspartate O-methyltransferase family protein [Candidatus Ichthyocystis hellenicum]|uniref:protein-L-isoaspartate O-methyltransferase family protein n=1 Tax=Candidatus Ichthyocystis hellenicum TaxID=1561003 RepID=UPI000B8872A1|nr:methyltransferase domain-containing protein [Candidatus Ichthyocystis hellenicum]